MIKFFDPPVWLIIESDVPDQIPDTKYKNPDQLLWLLHTILNWDNLLT